MLSSHRSRLLFVLSLAGVLAAVGLVAPSAVKTAPTAQAQAATVRLEWLGWSHFRLTSPTGKVVLTNPYITGNPDAAIGVDDVSQADLILVADAHRDEYGDTVAIAQKTGSRVYGGSRLVRWLTQQGMPESSGPGGNQGDRLVYQGITVRQLLSIHDNSVSAPTADVFYGGVASSFMITFENGWTVYFSGSSAATSDMALWGSMYKPDMMIFHMSGTHDTLDVAMSIKLMATDNPNRKTLMPHHHRVSPTAGSTSIADVQAALEGMGINIPITNQVRTQVYEFAK